MLDSKISSIWEVPVYIVAFLPIPVLGEVSAWIMSLRWAKQDKAQDPYFHVDGEATRRFCLMRLAAYILFSYAILSLVIILRAIRASGVMF